MSADSYAFALETDAADAEALADAIGDAAHPAVCGVQLDDAATMDGRDLPPGRARLTVYAGSDEAAAGDLAAALVALTPAIAAAGWRRLTIAPQDWNATWKAHFRALDLGRRLRIEPPWDRHPAGVAGRITLVIDPGMAFGTGSHETTRLATTLVEDAIEGLRAAGADLGAMTLIDVGTGSGLIAIAAVRLGVGQAVAIDNDAVAIDSARDNLRHNDLADRVVLVVAERPVPRPAAPLVVANIISSVLLALREDLLAITAPGGLLVLSGVLGREAAGFLPRFAGADFAVVAADTLGEWAGWTLRRRPLA